MRSNFLATLVLITVASVAAALAPLSAIDWLSESINNPPEFKIEPETEPLVEPIVQTISIKKGLSPVSPDAIGLLSPSLTGFFSKFMGGYACDRNR